MDNWQTGFSDTFLSDAECDALADAEHRAARARNAIRAANAALRACLEHGDRCPVDGYDIEDLLVEGL